MSELKNELEHRSERFDLEPGALDRFFRRRERRERRRRVAAICLALGVTAAGALLAVRALSSDEPVPAAPKSDEELLAELAGTYTVSLTDAMPFVIENGLAGEYEMTLRPDGVMELSAPAGFVEGRNPSGITFRISGDELTTNAFVNVTCHSTVGRYRWTLQGGTLTLDPIVDACGLRRTLFTSGEWERRT